MADVVSRETRSRMMAGIRGRDTKPELLVRRELHRRGHRYRLHARKLPGRPDLALARYRAAIFIQGCFWHRHEGCRFTTTPKSNARFWADKFEQNVARDRRIIETLRSQGWRVATVWECALRRHGAAPVVDAIERWLSGTSDVFDVGEDLLDGSH